MNYDNDILSSIFGAGDYLAHVPKMDDSWWCTEMKTLYRCPTCSQDHKTPAAAQNCCSPAPTPPPPPIAKEKSEVLRDREVTMDEARALGVLDAMLRKRVRIEHMEIDYDWLNENCTGLYMVTEPTGAIKIGFELDEDYALFKLKFHMA